MKIRRRALIGLTALVSAWFLTACDVGASPAALRRASARIRSDLAVDCMLTSSRKGGATMVRVYLQAAPRKTAAEIRKSIESAIAAEVVAPYVVVILMRSGSKFHPWAELRSTLTPSR